MNSSNKFLVSSTVIVGTLAALWNFTVMLRAWLLSTQRDVASAFTMFVFLGLVPVVGVVASMLRKRWGPWLLIAGPMCSLIGFPFLSGFDFGFLARFVAMYCIPLFLAALGFLYLMRKSDVRGNRGHE
jgi:hypothetical protein